MKTKVYMVITNDEMETPVFVGRNLKEVADEYNTSRDAIACAITRGNTFRKKFKIIKVEYDEGEE